MPFGLCSLPQQRIYQYISIKTELEGKTRYEFLKNKIAF